MAGEDDGNLFRRDTEWPLSWWKLELFMAWHINVDGSGVTFCGVLTVADRHLTTTLQSSHAPLGARWPLPWTSVGAMAIVGPPSPEAPFSSCPLRIFQRPEKAVTVEAE